MTMEKAGTSTHEVWEFEQRVSSLGKMLDEIPVLLGEVDDVMLSIARQGLSMAPARGGGDRPLPGGRALVVLGPVADHATWTDDLPHPVTVLRGLADLVREWMGEPSVPAEPRDAALAFLRASVRWVVAHEELEVWVVEKLEQVLGLLRSLTGHVERAEPRIYEPEELEARLVELLDERQHEVRMLPAEAEHFWPGISGRIKAHRSRARAQAQASSKRMSKVLGRQVDFEPDYALEPDEAGRYLASDLAEFDRAKGHDRRAGACQDRGAV